MSTRGAARGALVATVALLALLASPVEATGATGGIDVDHVEVSDGEGSALVSVDRLGAEAVPDLGSVHVAVGGVPVDSVAEPVEAGDLQRTTVLALDASSSMAGDPIREAKAAALSFVDAAPADVRIGLVTFAGVVSEVRAPTTDRAALRASIEAIELHNGTRLYDAVAAAVALAGDEGARSVVLLSDGRDQGSDLTLVQVRDLVSDGTVVMDVVALDQGADEQALLGSVAAVTGGMVVQASDPASLSSVFAGEAEAFARQLVVDFPVPANSSGPTEVTISLTTDDGTVHTAATVATLPAATVAGPGGPSLVTARWVMLGGASAIGVALAIVLAIVLVGGRRARTAQERLSTYLGETTPDNGSGLRTSVVAAAQAVVPRDVEARLARRLTGAGLSLKPSEWVLLHAGIAVVAGLVGIVLGGPVLMVLLLLAGAVGPPVFLRVKHSRRLAAFGAQLPETLSMIANSLSAGLAVAQAIDTVVREGQEPMAGELRRALVEQRLGVSIDDALEGVAARMGSEDFAWVVMAIRIQREVGGNLSEVLTTVAATLRERESVRRQVHALSAEGRLSAWILGLLPVLMFAYLLVANRDFVRPLYTETLGWLLLGAAVLLLSVGTFAMSRLVKVEV